MTTHKQLHRRLPALVCLFAALAMVASATAADWGALKGRFVLDGKAADPAKLNVNKDTEFCGKHDLVDEVVVVADDGSLANVFVYLYLKKGKKVDVHPDYEASLSEPVVLDNKGCRFEPHVMVLRTSQPFEVRNSDSGISHNTNITPTSNPGFNQIVPNDTPLVKEFKKRESYPSPVACNIHPWMKAYVLIRDNPYMAVSDAEGNFEIANIPAGEHEFTFWHEGGGNMKKISVGGEETSRRGRAKLEIPAGDTLDLGDIKVKPSVLGQ